MSREREVVQILADLTAQAHAQFYDYNHGPSESREFNRKEHGKTERRIILFEEELKLIRRADGYRDYLKFRTPEGPLDPPERTDEQLDAVDAALALRKAEYTAPVVEEPTNPPSSEERPKRPYTRKPNG